MATFELRRDYLEELHKRLSDTAWTGARKHYDYWGRFPGPVPHADTLAEVLSAAFWASLGKEEGRSVSFSLLLSPSDEVDSNDKSASEGFEFANPIPLTARSIVKLAPAIANSSLCFRVSPNSTGSYEIRGLSTWSLGSLRIDTIGSGEMVISVDDWFHAYISANQVGFADTRSFRLCPSRQPEVSDREIESYLIPDDLYEPVDSPDTKLARVQWNILSSLAQQMRSLGHGGAILSVVDDKWVDSVKHPNPLEFSPNKMLKNSALKPITLTSEKSGAHSEWQQAIEQRDRHIRAFARLTAIDGALVLHRDLSALAIGARIQPPEAALTGLEKVVETAVFEGSTPLTTKLLDVGGMRHVSAVQFVHANRSSVAFVASQDGPLSLVRWSREHESVLIIRRVEVIVPRLPT